ncbi:MAG: hypothetical protein JWO81_2636 [Alphaproteobacteria bacterium]|nr:hypothetical protein [Alphaproteobacteria bacterium]
MADFKDPTRLTRAAIVVVAAWMASNLLQVLLRFLGPGPAYGAGVVAVLRLFILPACWILVGMWIYRTNANAHALGGDVSITPGWAIGWFIIPFANLILPYQGVSETWLASHEMAGLDGEAGLPLLRWWWGLWIVSGFVGYAAFFLARDPELVDAASYALLAEALLQAALSLVLIRLMRRLATVQTTAHPGHVFA